MMRNLLYIGNVTEIENELFSALKAEGIDIICENTAKRAYMRFIQQVFTIVVCDLHATEMDGINVLLWFHKQQPVPLVAISSVCSSTEEIQALTAGADQYWVRPLEPKVVIPRIKALIRRYELDCQSTKKPAGVLDFDYGIKIDLNIRKAFWQGEDAHLTPKQFALLAFLAVQAGQTVSKEQLYEAVWNENYDISCDQTLKYHVSELRRKLKDLGAEDLIQTRWCYGYELKPNGEQQSSA